MREASIAFLGWNEGLCSGVAFHKADDGLAVLSVDKADLSVTWKAESDHTLFQALHLEWPFLGCIIVVFQLTNFQFPNLFSLITYPLVGFGCKGSNHGQL